MCRHHNKAAGEGCGSYSLSVSCWGPRPQRKPPRRPVNGCRLSTARPARGSTAPPAGRSNCSAKAASRRASAAAAPSAPGWRGRPAAAPGTIWASATRGWCVCTRTPTRQTESEEESVKQVRLEFGRKKKKLTARFHSFQNCSNIAVVLFHCF